MNRLIRASIRLLQAYTPGEQPTGRRIVKLNTNENPYPLAPQVAAALARAAGDLRRYPDPLCLNLRRALARYHGCEPDQIFVGNGSDEVLRLCIQVFVDPGGSVGYFDPSYSLYPVLANIAGAQKLPVALAPDFGWAMPARYRASLFFLTTPNAPTGIQYPAETLRQFCQTFPGVVVLDEAYVDFAERNDLRLALELPNVLVARSLSKSFSLAGLRLGYVIGASDLIAGFYQVKDSYNVGRPAQQAALAALQAAGRMRAHVRRIRATREWTTDELARRGFHVTPSQANFLWTRPPRGSARALFMELRRRGILVRHFPGPRTHAHLRVSIGREEDMRALLQAIDRWLAKASRPARRT